MGRRRGPALVSVAEEEGRAIRGYYERLLESGSPVPAGAPVDVVGPTWARADGGGWLLPERTIALDAMVWASSHLRGPDGGPWRFTAEQARFLAWYYAVGDDGRFLTPTVVLQRCKGWGKDPLAAVLALIALLGPSVPETDDGGDTWHGRPERDPWIRLLAVSQEQTRTTMGNIPSLVTPEMRSEYSLHIGTGGVTRRDGSPGVIIPITSNPHAAEGSRATLTVCTETQNWTRSNSGVEMMGVVRGDAAKSPPERQARILHLCNAARSGEESVGLTVREGHEQGRDAAAGIMYDSLEASAQAVLSAEEAPRVVEAVRGDAIWLTPSRVVQDIMDPSTPPSEARRKWYNQVVAAETSWMTRQEWDACCDPGLPELDPGDECCVFFDGGKSDDATACVAVRVSDGAPFVVGLWQRPPDARAHGWVAPREQVDAAVRDFAEHHRVVGLWADPSHALDDVTMERFWDEIVDGWHRDYGRRLALRASREHSVNWDMSNPAHHKTFVRAVQAVTTEVLEGQLVHDGDARLRAHILHCVRYPTKYGVSISKEHRESRKKIDLAVCMVGARMMRAEYRNRRTSRSRGLIW